MRTLEAGLLLLLALGGVPLAAQGRDNAPQCRMTPGAESPLEGNAGCLVKINNTMLLIRHRETAGLSPPGGTPEKEETAQCTAHRETWEETRVEVIVGTLLKNFDDQFYLFHCIAVNKELVTDPRTQLPVPEGVEREVSEVLFLDPTTVSNDSWRFPTDAPALRDAFYDVWNQNPENSNPGDAP